jgi:hypothetical protein
MLTRFDYVVGSVPVTNSVSPVGVLVERTAN